MKKSRIFHFLLLGLAMFFFASIAQAELKIDSVYPNVGEMGKDLTVTVRGSGFDENTRVSMALDTGNRAKIIGSVDTPGRAYGITVVGNTAYVADTEGGVQIIDISNPLSPAIISSVDTPGYARSIEVVGEIAYVADSGSILAIDISHPLSPVIISSVDTPGNAWAITIVGETAYVADDKSGVQVIDISNPLSPVIIGSVDTPNEAYDITVVDEIAYVAVPFSGLQVIDISNPSSPVIIGSADTGIATLANAVTVVGEIAYLADNSSGLHVIDISNPSSPEIINSFEKVGYSWGITVDNDIAYVASDYAIQVLDISQPSSPIIIGSVKTLEHAIAITVVDETAYVADGDVGVLVIDISTPPTPVIIGSVDKIGEARDVTVVGETAYVADGKSLHSIDISNPSSPVILNSVDMPGYANDISVVGETAYVADRHGGVQVIDISHPFSPVIIGSVETPGSAYGIKVVDETAYVADDESGVQVIDISHPASPVIIGSVETPGYAIDISVVGETVYVANVDHWRLFSRERDGGVLVIDISQPASPVIIDYVNTPGDICGITTVGDVAIVADGLSGVQVIDISNPSSSMIIGSVDTPGFAYDVTVIGKTAYVADSLGGIQVIDISQPSSPAISGYVDTPGDAEAIKVKGDKAYVADSYAGLSIVPLPSQITSLSVVNESEIIFTIPSPEIKGSYNIRAFNQTESGGMIGAVTFADKETIAQLKTQKAIILSGSGPFETNTLWQSTQLCTSYAYFALMNQGYLKENIRYLSAAPSDADGDGITDVVSNATYQNFKSAVLNWTSDANDLLIFMTGHGGDGKFEINGLTDPPEYVTVQELDTWLDLIQQNMNGKVILIYDACMSGSFIDQLEPLAGKERIVITSSSPNENAWFLEKGALSFSYQFWASVILNANLYDSFVVAKNLMASDQTCQINANGDTIPNDKTDQALAQNIIIGRGRIAASSPPVISDVSEDQVLQNGSTSSIIQAFNINGLNPIKRVWAVIIPPGMENASSDTPITDLPTIELEDLDGDGTYEGIYENFSEYGTYYVSVYAEDSEELYAVPLQTSVTQTQFSVEPEPEPNPVPEPEPNPNSEWNKIRDDLWIRAEISTVEKGLINGQWQLGGQDTTARGDQVFWGYFYASPDDVTWGSSNNPDLFVKIWVDVTGPIYVDYFHVSVPDITVYTDFNAGNISAADQTHTATLTTRFVEHSYINGQSDFTLQNEDGAKAFGYSETAAPNGTLLNSNLKIGTMINTVEKGAIEGIWREGGRDNTARGDTVIWGHFYANPSLVTWGSPQNPDLFVKIWFDVGGMVNVDFFHVSVPDIEVYSELPADGAYDNSGTTVLGNRFIEHRYVWK